MLSLLLSLLLLSVSSSFVYGKYNMLSCGALRRTTFGAHAQRCVCSDVCLSVYSDAVSLHVGATWRRLFIRRDFMIDASAKSYSLIHRAPRVFTLVHLEQKV